MILLYRPLFSSSHTSAFQKDVDLISSWLAQSGLVINPSKSSLLVICRCRTKPCVSITINSSIVPCVESIKYLGVTISSDLKWNSHILNTCKSAKQKLGLLHRNFRQADCVTLSRLYKALVLPKLDYCSCVWDPASSTTLTEKLESVQRFAAKLCTKRWSDSPSLLTARLNWPNLHSRRSRQKLQLCRRIIRKESVIPPSSHFSPPSHVNPRTSHPFTVNVPHARTTAFQSSFFVSVCRLWNSLPEGIAQLSSSRSFKFALSSLIT